MIYIHLVAQGKKELLNGYWAWDRGNNRLSAVSVLKPCSVNMDPDAMALVHSPTEEVPSPDNVALRDAIATIPPNVNAPGVGANMTMLRVNQAGVADTELARIQFAQQINAISVNTGTPVSVIESLAETAHRTRIEEVEAIMNSHYSNEVRRLEVTNARQASNFETQYLAEVNELRNRASRSEVETQRNMIGEQYEAVTARDRAINQLRSELSIAQTMLRDASNAEDIMRVLREELRMEKAQTMSYETAGQQAVAEVRADCVKREEYYQNKVNAEWQMKLQTEQQNYQNTLAIQRNKISAQARELEEQRSEIAMSSERYKKMYDDMKAMRLEMQDNQTLKEEILESKMGMRRLRAELDGMPRETPTDHRYSTQGPMPPDESFPKSGAFPSEMPRPERETPNKTGKEYDVPGFMKSNQREPEGNREKGNSYQDAWANYLGPNERGEGARQSPSREFGPRGGGSANLGQPSSSSRPNIDANTSNEDLLRAALLQVLGSNIKPGAPKVKEADSLKFPEFPRPENYRKWKTAVREEIRASSDKPDEAWVWLMEVYQDREDSRRLLQELSEPGQFVTLDTKILAQLSRVAKGDLGTQILNFKEVEAANGRVVRGRQVLFMFEQYFRTNEEAGALYGTEDLLKIHLINDDLATFIRNWDAVIAGMKHLPDNNTLKDIFMREVRKTKRMEYDLKVYERSREGSETRSYQYLVQAVRDILSRDRLKENRDRIARMHAGKFSVPTDDPNQRHRSPGPNDGGKGMCFQFQNTGKCKFGNKCKYQHARGASSSPNRSSRSHSRASHSSRGSSPSRSSPGRSRPKDKSKIPCRFFKSGKCKRGETCPFLHESAAPATPTRRRREPSPARNRRSSGRDRSKGRDRRDRRPRSRSSERSASPNSKSGSDKPAAICIPVSLACKTQQEDYWEVSKNGHWITRHHVEPRNSKFKPDKNSFPVDISHVKSARWTMIALEGGKVKSIQDDWRAACTSSKAEKTWKGKTMFKIRRQYRDEEGTESKKVRFNTKPEVVKHEVDCIAYSHIKDRHKPAKVYTTEKCPKSSPKDTEEAIKCAESLQAMVKSMLASNGELPKCQFVCDHDPIGPHDLCCSKCRQKHGIESPSFSMVPSTPARNFGVKWLGDTGTDQDIIGENYSVVEQGHIHEAESTLTLSTANGPVTTSIAVDTHLPGLVEGFSPYVLKSSPPALSIGQRCMEEGYDFIWGKDNKPLLVRPDGKVVEFKMNSRVPYLDDECLPKAIPNHLLERLQDTIEKIHDCIDPGRYAMSASDIEVEGGPPPEPEFVEPGAPEDGPREVPFEGPIEEEGVGVYGNKTEEQLRAEAKSKKHVFTHRPKNPYCDVCNRSKMLKHYARKTDGSRHVQAESFGDHIVADFVLIKRAVEQGVDGQNYMLVIKDIYSQYRYAYPVESREYEEVIKSVSHFLKASDSIGIAYTDNGREFIKAFEEMQVDHQTSIEYLDSTKSVVEREARTLIEGTRVNLNQTGMSLNMWPYAVRHHAMALNITNQISGDPPPWSLRNPTEFQGIQAPFGCLVWYWDNPKKPDPSRAKLAPTSIEGVFLGYNIQVGHVWRGEYLVAKLEGLDENIKENNVTVLRTKRIAFPDGDFVFPLAKTLPVVDSDLDFRLSIQGRPDDNDDEQYEPTDDEGGDDIPPPDDPPPPGRISTDDLERMIDERHEPDPSFRRHGTESTKAHPPTEPTEELIRAESVVIPEEERVDATDQGGEGHSSSSKSKPKSADDERRNPKFDVFVDYELDPNVMPNGKPTPKGFVWDGVRLVRRKANSKRVPGYPSDLWVRLDPVTRNIEWERYQKWLEEKEEKKKDKDKDKSSPAVNPSFSAPAMPVVENVYEPHRSPMRELVEEKIAELQEGLNFELFAAVARVLTKAEIGQSKDAQKALDVEWQKLIDKGVWDENRVTECRQVVSDAQKKGEKIHIGRIFEICSIKGDELPEGHPQRKYKGRTCFQGNNVFDENSDYAIFSEMSSSPASMEAAKVLDAFGSQPGYAKQQADARQAYTQAIFTGVPTYLRLPRNRWPKQWQSNYRDPLVPMLLALYGHPDSGGIWERYFEENIAKTGWRPVLKEIWRSVFYHPKLDLLLVVYVDDLKMAGPKSNLSQGWKSIADVIEIDAPEPFGRYFRCEHRVEENIKLSKEDHPFHHIFSTVKTAAVAHQHRTNDFWEHDKANKTWTRYHIYPRKRRWIPRDCYDDVPTAKFEHARWTYVDGVDEPILDDWVKSGDIDQGGWWTGKTVFTYQDDGDNDGDHEIYSLAAKKKNGGAHRVKSIAKKKAKQQRFRSIEDITVPKNECMSKSVNMVYYDMKNFLESCVEAYCTLAKVDKSSLKRVSTPFIDLKIAKPVESEKEPVGRLQPIASKVLMKILFAARMARYDLLRATQALASRVTKWSRECDDALHRLVSYINCSLTSTMRGYIGDKFSECQLWLFADADFAGAHDSKSTTGSFMALVGPNTYFPINAFSKKQTAVAMSSTEAEVIAANHSVRAQGLPSLSLFNYLLAMSDPDTALEERQKQAGLQAMPKATSPKDPVSIARIDPELDEIRYGFFHNGPESVANVNHLQVHLGKSFTVQFMEDNQATITILTTGESQSMRHTDRTQRVSFGWLQQQFQGDQFDLVNVNTSYQVADLLTKPFTSPAKWQHAIDLLGLVDYEYTPPTKPTLVASPRGEGDSCYDRIMIEYCCSENSKLGEENRKHAKGCKVIRVTKDDDATRGECITKTVKKVEEFMKSNPKEKTDLMIYISLPCTGGCPWNNVNKESPNGRERIKEHQKLFKRLFKGYSKDLKTCVIVYRMPPQYFYSNCQPCVNTGSGKEYRLFLASMGWISISSTDVS